MPNPHVQQGAEIAAVLDSEWLLNTVSTKRLQEICACSWG